MFFIFSIEELDIYIENVGNINQGDQLDFLFVITRTKYLRIFWFGYVRPNNSRV